MDIIQRLPEEVTDPGEMGSSKEGGEGGRGLRYQTALSKRCCEGPVLPPSLPPSLPFSLPLLPTYHRAAIRVSMSGKTYCMSPVASRRITVSEIVIRAIPPKTAAARKEGKDGGRSQISMGNTYRRCPVFSVPPSLRPSLPPSLPACSFFLPPTSAYVPESANVPNLVVFVICLC